MHSGYLNTKHLSVILASLSIAVMLFGLPPMNDGKASVSFDHWVNTDRRGSLASNNFQSVGLELEDIDVIKECSEEYGIDYRLIIALIKQESRFDKEAVSERGAVGLMQIMPVTDAEIREELQIDDSKPSDKHLRVGIYYYSRLFALFQDCSKNDQLSLALAAYNAGPSRIYDAQELAAYMGENPNSWESIRNALPLLSKRYYSLHKAVWNEGKPKNGCFGGWRQTVTFVDNIMDTYQQYKKSEN